MASVKVPLGDVMSARTRPSTGLGSMDVASTVKSVVESRNTPTIHIEYTQSSVVQHSAQTI